MTGQSSVKRGRSLNAEVGAISIGAPAHRAAAAISHWCTFRIYILAMGNPSTAVNDQSTPSPVASVTRVLPMATANPMSKVSATGNAPLLLRTGVDVQTAAPSNDPTTALAGQT